MSRVKRPCKQIFARGTNWFLVLLTIALVLTACSPTEQTPTQYVFDDLGRLVAINGTPQRIISLAPSNTEILFALGLGDKVVGVTDWCDYPPEALDKEKVGGYDTPDIEKIAALTPDLILVAYGTPIDVINTLEGLGELEERPRVFYIVWHDPLWTAGSETFIHELIEKGGGVNICQNITGYTIISIEEVVARNPEVIITSEWSLEWAQNETLLQGTNASQEGRIYQGDDDLVQRPGPRLVEGLEWFAYFIHPEIFEEPEGS
jgi:iron complex transport system substrate-binding protein